MIQIPYNFTPRPYQLKLFQAMDGIEGKPETRKKRAFLRWHRRAGKDKACWCYMIKEAARCPGNYFYIFPQQKEAKQALWENVDKEGFKLLQHIPDEFIKRIANHEMAIELTNGSTIRVIGLDQNPDAIRGSAIRGAVFSEFAYQDPAAYRTAMPAVIEADGWVIFNSTPAGRNHMYKMDMNIQKDPTWFYSVLQTTDPTRPNYSGALNKEQLNQIQMEFGLEIDDMEREYGVSYSAGLKGAFYADQIEKARTDERIGSFPASDHKWVDTFWDLGIDDSTAVWFRQVDGGRVIWIDYYEANNKPLSHYVEILAEKGYNYRTHYLPHDGAHRNIQTLMTSAELFRSLCKEAQVSSDVEVVKKLPVQDGINAVRSRFSKYYFNEGTTQDGINKLELYHRRYDRKRDTYLKEPVHDSNSHAADAIRMEACSEEFDDKRDDYQIKVVSDYEIL